MKRNTAPRTSRRLQAGFTAIEVSIALLIGILVLAAAGAGIQKMFAGNDLQTEVSNITQILVNTKTLRSSGGYGAADADLVPSLIATDGIPKTMSVVSGVPKNAWDGTVAVVSTGAGYSISTAAVPKAACIQLATKISKGGAVTTKIGTAAAVTGEVTTAAATTGCASATANTIIFTMSS